MAAAESTPSHCTDSASYRLQPLLSDAPFDRDWDFGKCFLECQHRPAPTYCHEVGDAASEALWLLMVSKAGDGPAKYRLKIYFLTPWSGEIKYFLECLVPKLIFLPRHHTFHAAVQSSLLAAFSEGKPPSHAGWHRGLCPPLSFHQDQQHWVIS